MIKDINIRGFKRFADESFKFAPLVVLAGLNGSGKTSLIQSLLIAAEGSRSRSSSVSLNGPFGLELGAAEDVLNWRSTSPIKISIGVRDISESIWQFGVPQEDALYLDLVERPNQPPKPFLNTPRAFTYLSAERIGPRGYTAASPLPEAELEVGIHGEFCAHVLSVLGDKVIKALERRHPAHQGKSARLLKYEIEQWLCEIARPIEVTGKRAAGATVSELRFRAPGSTWVRSTRAAPDHVGSYASYPAAVM